MGEVGKRRLNVEAQRARKTVYLILVKWCFGAKEVGC